jgi:hypothetical protein
MAAPPSMEEPLLGGGNGEEKKGGSSRLAVVAEVRKQLYLAGPLIAGWLLQNVVQMISVMFVGHLGELELSSASIATSFAGVTGFSLLVHTPALPQIYGSSESNSRYLNFTLSFLEYLKISNFIFQNLVLLNTFYKIT